MNVERYEFELYHFNGGEMLVSDTGDYVSYEDFASLEQKLAESKREFRAADATIENLQMQVEKLAAENAGLKSALNPEVIPDTAVEAFNETAIMDHDWNETSEWSWVENDTDVIRAVLEAIKPETQATDAFLAEVRAQGVEMLREHPAIKLCSLTHVCDEFAAQLRKGVQS